MNLDIEDGRDVGQDRQRVKKTFPAYAQEWLLKKRAALGNGKSIRRYKAVMDNSSLYLMGKHLEKAPRVDLDYSVCDNYVKPSTHAAHDAVKRLDVA